MTLKGTLASFDSWDYMITSNTLEFRDPHTLQEIYKGPKVGFLVLSTCQALKTSNPSSYFTI